MSLVNETLQELESRRGDDTVSRYAAVNVKVGRAEKPNGARKMMVAGMALLAIAAVIFRYQQPADLNHQPVAAEPEEPVGTVGAEVVAGEPIVELLPEALPIATATTESSTAGVQGVDSSPDRVIRGLLDAGNLALSRDRLILPAGDNARDYFQQVLDLLPRQPEAMLGMRAIARRYFDLAQAQRVGGDSVTALMLVGRGLSLEPDNTALLGLREALLSDHAQAIAAQTPAEPMVEPAQNHGAKLIVQPSDENLDLRRANAARRKAENGDLQTAIGDLEALRRDGQLGPEGTSVLADLYLQVQQPEAAIRLVEGQAVLPSETAAYLIARSQLQSGNLAAAQVTLEAHRPVISAYPDYYSLLAGIYQQGGQNRLAATLYQRLASLQPEIFTHWLGLAVSLDNLQEVGALSAFRRVLPMIPEQQQGLIDYVRQRLVALTPR